LVVLSLLLSRHGYADNSVESNQTQIQSRAREILDKLTLDEKIGQLFLFGFIGTDFQTHLKHILQNYHPGGIILFGRNIKTAAQVLKLNSQAQRFVVSKTSVPLLIAVDQEGGTVSRIKSSPPQPSALAIGNTDSPDLSEKIGFYTGKILKSLGFNLNLAPVVDVADPSSPSFLGTRSFSGSPDSVSEFSLAFATGLHQSGVMSTLKHFPGHGNEKYDPHFKIPTIREDLQTLESTRLVPFKYLIENFQPGAIMVAHLAIPKIDPAAKTATYSKILIQDLLRAKWGYQGIVMTDDIDMAAAQDESSSPAQQAVHALQAGVDMVMVAWNKKTQRRVTQEVKRSLANGNLTMKDIDGKVSRILATKLKFNLFNPSQPSLKEVSLALRDPNLKRAYGDVTYRNLDRSIASSKTPVKKSSRVVVLSRSKYFMNSFTQKLPKKCCVALSLVEIADINKTLASQKDSIAVIHVSGRGTANLVNGISRFLRKRVIIVNTNSPSLVLAPETYAKTINLFTYHPELGGLIAEKVVSPFSTNKYIHME